MIYSNNVTMQRGTGLKRPETTEVAGRVRVLVIDTVVAEVGKDVILADMAAGRIRILGMQSSVNATFATPATTLKVGVSAYTNINRQPVPAADAGLLAATEGSALTNKPLAIPGASGLLVPAGSAWRITATASADLAVGDKITGTILYVND